MPVAIIVGPGRARAESAAADASFFSNVFELAIAKIAIQYVAAVSGDVNVEEPVVVEIGDGHAHAPSAASKARGLCDVLESSVRLLVIEGNHRVATLAVAIDSRAVHGHDIEFAVVVAIKQANSSAHGFDHVTLVRRGLMSDGQAAFLADVLKYGAAICGSLVFILRPIFILHLILRTGRKRTNQHYAEQDSASDEARC